MTDPPTFSVIVPVFNAEETVAEAIESVQAQTCEDWELIAIDDGSTDGSSEVVARYAAADPRIRLIPCAHRGAAAARNTGFEAARSTYCALLDADDIWLPQKLQLQLPHLADRTVVYSDSFFEEGGQRHRLGRRIERPDGVSPSGHIFDELLRDNFVCGITAVLPTRLLREVGGYDETLPSSHDWDLWLRLALADVPFTFVPEPLAVYRIRSASLSSDQRADRYRNVRLLRGLLDRANDSRRAAIESRLRRARRELEVYLRKRAWLSAAAGDTRSARRNLFDSARANPRSFRAVAAALLSLAPPLLRWYAKRQPPADFRGEFVRS
ncbi:MAG TPA: glycosyltransferase [Gaiellaceae bacterium]|nr:glycosyltransferase [Gaiellaceae bacterium]